MNASDRDPAPGGLSLRLKIGIYVACWLLALLATNPSAGLLPLIYMFPLGLAAFVFPHNTPGGGWTVLLAGVGFYVAQAIVYFRARSRGRTMIMLVILVLALICNVAGCRRMIDTH